MHLDRPTEECGVLAVATQNDDAARLAFFGLYALQHRGQEAAGIAVSDGRAVRVHKGQGLVSQVFQPGTVDPLVGSMAVGHTRYSTTGASSERNVQPYVVETMHGPLAVAHNGNLTN
ncbi:MAG: class II glutamine amidotransferase, partial [Acidimicrobiia bacterium]|nr:class II glutamine amidotransferase [Acidimicrobiia bacterium]